MSLNRYFGLSITLVLLFISALALSQTQTTPEGLDTGEPDGLDTGLNDYKNFNERPAEGWERNVKLRQIAHKATTACFSACHGQDKMNKNRNIPNIAGQKFYYVRKQLETYKKNNPDPGPGDEHDWEIWERSYPAMNSVTAKVGNKLYVYMADLISKMPCDREQKGLMTQGLPKEPKPLKRCASCHGKDGRGTFFNIPIIAGQSYTYLRRQLLAIRDRANDAAKNKKKGWRNHPTMEPYVEVLSNSDVYALAKYYSAQGCRGAETLEPK